VPVELGQVTSITDFLQTDHFSFELPALPGGGDREAFVIRNLSAVLPGRSNQAVSGEIHRFKIKRAGKPVWNQSFVANYMDTVDRKIIDGLYAWQALNNDPETGLPRPSSEYMTAAVAVLYDMENNEVERRVFRNLWIEKIEDVALNGAQPGMINLAVTFSYDYWVRG
jgi:hypothetical protein